MWGEVGPTAHLICLVLDMPRPLPGRPILVFQCLLFNCRHRIFARRTGRLRRIWLAAVAGFLSCAHVR